MTSVAQPDGRRLAVFAVASEPGNERMALARVAEAVAGHGLPAARLERLKTAVAEATMNAIEHGNQGRPEIPVDVEVIEDGDDIVFRHQLVHDAIYQSVPAPLRRVMHRVTLAGDKPR